MPIINIDVKNKIANDPLEEIVCWNSDYVVQFTFDEEWDDHVTKTARFSYNGTTEDVVFDGFTVPVPKIRNANTCAIGVFAGNIATTTPAIVRCKKSILCENGVPADPTPDVYTQLSEKIDTVAQKMMVAEEQASTAMEIATTTSNILSETNTTLEQVQTTATDALDVAMHIGPQVEGNTQDISDLKNKQNDMDEQMGEIDTALDNIIEIQNNLMIPNGDEVSY